MSVAENMAEHKATETLIIVRRMTESVIASILSEPWAMESLAFCEIISCVVLYTPSRKTSDVLSLSTHS